MASDTNTMIRELEARIADVQRRRARSEHEQDAARAAVAAALTALKSEFGVSTVEEAKVLLTSLSQSMMDAVTATKTSLEGIEG